MTRIRGKNDLFSMRILVTEPLADLETSGNPFFQNKLCLPNTGLVNFRTDFKKRIYQKKKSNKKRINQPLVHFMFFRIRFYEVIIIRSYVTPSEALIT